MKKTIELYKGVSFGDTSKRKLIEEKEKIENGNSIGTKIENFEMHRRTSHIFVTIVEFDDKNDPENLIQKNDKFDLYIDRNNKHLYRIKTLDVMDTTNWETFEFMKRKLDTHQMVLDFYEIYLENNMLGNIIYMLENSLISPNEVDICCIIENSFDDDIVKRLFKNIGILDYFKGHGFISTQDFFRTKYDWISRLSGKAFITAVETKSFWTFMKLLHLGVRPEICEKFFKEAKEEYEEYKEYEEHWTRKSRFQKFDITAYRQCDTLIDFIIYHNALNFYQMLTDNCTYYPLLGSAYKYSSDDMIEYFLLDIKNKKR